MTWLLLFAAVLGVIVLSRSAGTTRPSGGGSGVDDLNSETIARVNKWRGIVRSAIAFHGARVSESLVLALIARESAGKERALGDADDRGLMQITRPAWQDYVALSGDPAPPSFDDMWTAESNVRVGVWYLQNQIDAMGSTYHGLRAYNRGVGGAKEDPTAGSTYAEWILAAEPSFRAVA